MMNPWQAMAGGDGTGYGMGTDPANMTPEAQARRRQLMFAQALMGQANGQPQRSGWGAVNQAVMPILGGAMYRQAQQQPMQATQGSGFGASTPNLIWNPNNPVGTSSMGLTTSNQGSDWLNNLASGFNFSNPNG